MLCNLKDTLSYFNSFLFFYLGRYCIEINQKIIEQGLETGIFTKKPSYHLLQCTISGTIFNAMHGMKMYKEYLKKQKSDFDEKHYENQYFQEASDHVKTIVRGLVGYQG